VELRTAFDAQFLFDVCPDEEGLYDFLLALGEFIDIDDLEILIRKDWRSSMNTAGGILDYGAEISIKEIREQVWRKLGRLKLATESEFCEGRALTDRVLVLLPFKRDEVNRRCGEAAVTEQLAVDAVEFQQFWRDLLEEHPKTSTEFQRFVPAAFLNLELGPEGRDNWDKMGYLLANIRADLVEHLAYLCDKAIDDFEKAGYNDGEFEKRAPIALSREAKASANRKCLNDAGQQINCRHHTKISEGRPGRIYFDLEDRTTIFVGKVCDHW
jgi:hypothetical protein